MKQIKKNIGFVCILSFLELTWIINIVAETQQLEKARVYLENGLFADAIGEYEDVLKADGTNVEALQGLAISLANIGELSRAAKMFSSAAAHFPQRAHELYYNAGLAYQQSSSIGDAIGAYTNCLSASKGTYRPCHIKIASCYRDIEEYGLVQTHLSEAIKLDSKSHDAYFYLGDTLNNLKHFSRAVEMYDMSLKLKPDNTNVWIAKGDTYSNMKKINLAVECYKKARILSPPTSQVHLNALIGYHFGALDLGIWQNYEINACTLVSLTVKAIEAHRKGTGPPSPLSPYRLLFLEAGQLEIFPMVSKSWSDALVIESKLQSSHSSPGMRRKDQFDDSDEDKLSMRTYDQPRKKEGCNLHIGYISRRFEDYPGTKMMLRIFEKHNRTRVCVHSFATGSDDFSIERETVRNTSDSFADVSLKSSYHGAEILKLKMLDVVVDYDGLHDFNNIKLLSQRPASIQATWLGFAGTTGQGRRVFNHVKEPPAIDYIIADKVILAPDMHHSQSYTEHFVYLPHSYQPQDEMYGGQRHLSLQERQKLRLRLLHAYALENSIKSESKLSRITNGIWLVCFNRQAKISPDAFEDWMQQLISLKFMEERRDIILVLMAESNESMPFMTANAAYWGVPSDRLLFFKRLPNVEYRNVLSVGDIFLDTRNYGTHTVASDAMFGGSPVLTLEGASFSSRVAHSLNAAAKVDIELVATSRKSYVNIIDSISIRQPGVLSGLRHRIESAFGSTFFNSSLFAKHLETAYISMHITSHIRHQTHLFSHNAKPRHIWVPNDQFK